MHTCIVRGLASLISLKDGQPGPSLFTLASIRFGSKGWS